MSEKKRELTPAQQKFLDALFGEAKGDYKKAIAIAGYAEGTSPSSIMKSLKDEIINMAKEVIAINAPRAAMELVDGMISPTQAGVTVKIKAAESILNRAGVAEQKGDNVDLKVPSGGLFILPAKEKRNEDSNEG